MTRCLLSLLVFAGWLAAGGPLRADVTNVAPVQSAVLENNVAYLRITQVGKDLAAEVSASQRVPSSTNKLIGTVLDLRFAGGDDLAAAKAVADLIAAKKLPLAILVNRQTSDAATALAEALRQARAGVVLGGAPTGLKPDIAITVDAVAEDAYLKNPYADLTMGQTNSVPDLSNSSPFIDHTSEADLVREKIKDGDEDEDSAPARPVEPQKPFIHDPTLARAVDLIQALAILRPSPR